MLSVRLVTADHEVQRPLADWDATYSEFRGRATTHAPVIRLFGATADGRRACVHVHGVLPYLYVPWDGSGPSVTAAHQLAAGLDRALALAAGRQTSTLHVHKVVLVRGIPFYGYHKRSHLFFKVFLYNPRIVGKAAELLQSGAVLHRSFQPHEVHVPYLLQFFIDFNLQGMNLVHFSSHRVRRRPGSGGDGDDGPSPISSCELEVDVHSAHILNRTQHLNVTDSGGCGDNPGLAAIWAEERARRRLAGDGRASQPTQEPVEERPAARRQPSEMAALAALRARLTEPSETQTEPSLASQLDASLAAECADDTQCEPACVLDVPEPGRSRTATPSTAPPEAEAADVDEQLVLELSQRTDFSQRMDTQDASLAAALLHLMEGGGSDAEDAAQEQERSQREQEQDAAEELEMSQVVWSQHAPHHSSPPGSPGRRLSGAEQELGPTAASAGSSHDRLACSPGQLETSPTRHCRLPQLDGADDEEPAPLLVKHRRLGTTGRRRALVPPSTAFKSVVALSTAGASAATGTDGAAGDGPLERRGDGGDGPEAELEQIVSNGTAFGTGDGGREGAEDATSDEGGGGADPGAERSELIEKASDVAVNGGSDCDEGGKSVTEDVETNSGCPKPGSVKENDEVSFPLSCGLDMSISEPDITDMSEVEQEEEDNEGAPVVSNGDASPDRSKHEERAGAKESDPIPKDSHKPSIVSTVVFGGGPLRSAQKRQADEASGDSVATARGDENHAMFSASESGDDSDSDAKPSAGVSLNMCLKPAVLLEKLDMLLGADGLTPQAVFPSAGVGTNSNKTSSSLASLNMSRLKPAIVLHKVDRLIGNKLSVPAKTARSPASSANGPRPAREISLDEDEFVVSGVAAARRAGLIASAQKRRRRRKQLALRKRRLHLAVRRLQGRPVPTDQSPLARHRTSQCLSAVRQDAESDSEEESGEGDDVLREKMDAAESSSDSAESFVYDPDAGIDGNTVVVDLGLAWLALDNGLGEAAVWRALDAFVRVTREERSAADKAQEGTTVRNRGRKRARAVSGDLNPVVVVERVSEGVVKRWTQRRPTVLDAAEHVKLRRRPNKLSLASWRKARAAETSSSSRSRSASRTGKRTASQSPPKKRPMFAPPRTVQPEPAVALPRRHGPRLLKKRFRASHPLRKGPLIKITPRRFKRPVKETRLEPVRAPSPERPKTPDKPPVLGPDGVPLVEVRQSQLVWDGHNFIKPVDAAPADKSPDNVMTPPRTATPPPAEPAQPTTPDARVKDLPSNLGTPRRVGKILGILEKYKTGNLSPLSGSSDPASKRKPFKKATQKRACYKEREEEDEPVRNYFSMYHLLEPNQDPFGWMGAPPSLSPPPMPLVEADVTVSPEEQTYVPKEPPYTPVGPQLPLPAPHPLLLPISGLPPVPDGVVGPIRVGDLEVNIRKSAPGQPLVAFMKRISGRPKPLTPMEMRGVHMMMQFQAEKLNAPLPRTAVSEPPPERAPAEKQVSGRGQRSVPASVVTDSSARGSRPLQPKTVNRGRVRGPSPVSDSATDGAGEEDPEPPCRLSPRTRTRRGSGVINRTPSRDIVSQRDSVMSPPQRAKRGGGVQRPAPLAASRGLGSQRRRRRRSRPSWRDSDDTSDAGELEDAREAAPRRRRPSRRGFGFGRLLLPPQKRNSPPEQDSLRKMALFSGSAESALDRSPPRPITPTLMSEGDSLEPSCDDLLEKSDSENSVSGGRRGAAVRSPDMFGSYSGSRPASPVRRSNDPNWRLPSDQSSVVSEDDDDAAGAADADSDGVEVVPPSSPPAPLASAPQKPPSRQPYQFTHASQLPGGRLSLLGSVLSSEPAAGAASGGGTARRGRRFSAREMPPTDGGMARMGSDDFGVPMQQVDSPRRANVARRGGPWSPARGGGRGAAGLRPATQPVTASVSDAHVSDRDCEAGGCGTLGSVFPGTTARCVPGEDTAESTIPGTARRRMNSDVVVGVDATAQVPWRYSATPRQPRRTMVAIATRPGVPQSCMPFFVIPNVNDVSALQAGDNRAANAVAIGSNFRGATPSVRPRLLPRGVTRPVLPRPVAQINSQPRQPHGLIFDDILSSTAPDENFAITDRRATRPARGRGSPASRRGRGASRARGSRARRSGGMARLVFTSPEPEEPFLPKIGEVTSLAEDAAKDSDSDGLEVVFDSSQAPPREKQVELVELDSPGPASPQAMVFAASPGIADAEDSEGGERTDQEEDIMCLDSPERSPAAAAEDGSPGPEPDVPESTSSLSSPVDTADNTDAGAESENGGSPEGSRTRRASGKRAETNASRRRPRNLETAGAHREKGNKARSDKPTSPKEKEASPARELGLNAATVCDTTDIVASAASPLHSQEDSNIVEAASPASPLPFLPQGDPSQPSSPLTRSEPNLTNPAEEEDDLSLPTADETSIIDDSVLLPMRESCLYDADSRPGSPQGAGLDSNSVPESNLRPSGPEPPSKQDGTSPSLPPPPSSGSSPAVDLNPAHAQSQASQGKDDFIGSSQLKISSFIKDSKLSGTVSTYVEASTSAQASSAGSPGCLPSFPDSPVAVESDVPLTESQPLTEVAHADPKAADDATSAPTQLDEDMAPSPSPSISDVSLQPGQDPGEEEEGRAADHVRGEERVPSGAAETRLLRDEEEKPPSPSPSISDASLQPGQGPGEEEEGRAADHARGEEGVQSDAAETTQLQLDEEDRPLSPSPSISDASLQPGQDPAEEEEGRAADYAGGEEGVPSDAAETKVLRDEEEKPPSPSPSISDVSLQPGQGPGEEEERRAVEPVSGCDEGVKSCTADTSSGRTLSQTSSTRTEAFEPVPDDALLSVLASTEASLNTEPPAQESKTEQVSHPEVGHVADQVPQSAVASSNVLERVTVTAREHPSVVTADPPRSSDAKENTSVGTDASDIIHSKGISVSAPAEPLQSLAKASESGIDPELAGEVAASSSVTPPKESVSRENDADCDTGPRKVANQSHRDMFEDPMEIFTNDANSCGGVAENAVQPPAAANAFLSHQTCSRAGEGRATLCEDLPRAVPIDTGVLSQSSDGAADSPPPQARSVSPHSRPSQGSGLVRLLFPTPPSLASVQDSVGEIPCKQVEGCGRTPADPEFEGECGSSGLRHWRAVAVAAVDAPDTAALLTALERPETRALLAGQRPCRLTPVHLPPSRRSVELWLQRRRRRRRPSTSSSGTDSNDEASGGEAAAEDAPGPAEFASSTPLTQRPGAAAAPTSAGVTPLVRRTASYGTVTSLLTPLRRRPAKRRRIRVGVRHDEGGAETGSSQSMEAVQRDEDRTSGGEIKRRNSAASENDDPTRSNTITPSPNDVTLSLEPAADLRRQPTLPPPNRGDTPSVLEPSLAVSPSFGLGRPNSGDNTYGFRLEADNLQEAQCAHEHQYLSCLSLELHALTRGELRPDPLHDPVVAVFYQLTEDAPANWRRPQKLDGCIVLDAPSVCAEAAGGRRRLLHYAGLPDLTVRYVADEAALMQAVVELVSNVDPDILLGWEVQQLSWGYLFERAEALGRSILAPLSRLPESEAASRASAEADAYGSEHTSELRVAGRVVLNVWRLLRQEVPLYGYTWENIAYHVLHRREPHYSFRQLTEWWQHRSCINTWRVVDYYQRRCRGTLEILSRLDLIGRTAELARLFGIQFFDVISRGSQFRVESMMLRLARRKNLVAVSPSVQQRASSRAPESLPLILEPRSALYTEPVVVLDFQSLYPSIIIAYNYCFSTCLGRTELLGGPGAFPMGCTALQVPPDRLRRLLDQQQVHISPCGAAFVSSEVRRGVLPTMLSDILNTRIMVKKAMKANKENAAVRRSLDFKQLGLKLIANVTYGYTSANFSGRMPCIEVGDSVVSKGRETLERAIRMIESRPEWAAQVVYGDTDSLFVLLPGRSRAQAFALGQEMAAAVTADNPYPVKLKFEKVYQPCLLQTKKRYVGFMYETPDQQEPVYDAKGIETVRRDGCPAVAKILERSLRLLFTSLNLDTVRQYVTRQFQKLHRGGVSIADLTFAKEYRGRASYRPGAAVPALRIADRLQRADRRAEPRVGERVPYVVVYGAPGLPLIDLVRTPTELLGSPGLRPNAEYYVLRAVAPPLQRCLGLLGADVAGWYAAVPRRLRLPPPEAAAAAATIARYFSGRCCASCGGAATRPVCEPCAAQPLRTRLRLMEKLRCGERAAAAVDALCATCCGQPAAAPVACVSLDCPVLWRRTDATRDCTETEQHLRRALQALD